MDFVESIETDASYVIFHSSLMTHSVVYAIYNRHGNQR